MSESKGYEGWSIVEQMGHKKLGGYVREETVAGQGFLRIDVFTDGPEPVASQYVNPSTVYALTPTTEDVARGLARSCEVRPVTRWELAAPRSEPAAATNYGIDDDDDEDDDSDDEVGF